MYNIENGFPVDLDEIYDVNFFIEAGRSLINLI